MMETFAEAWVAANTQTPLTEAAAAAADHVSFFFFFIQSSLSFLFFFSHFVSLLNLKWGCYSIASALTVVLQCCLAHITIDSH